MQRLFQNKSEDITIEATFTFAESEIKHINATCRERIYARNWRQHIGGEIQYFEGGTFRGDVTATMKSIAKATAEESKRITDAAETEYYLVRAVISPDLEIHLDASPIVTYAFQVYDPEHIGVIDYHSSHRNYQRQRVSGLQINIEERSEQRASHSLYNWQQKYNNVKTELANAYVRDLIIKEAQGEQTSASTTIDTVRELFLTFFKDKSFVGPRAGIKGELSFPVIVNGSTEHDIDDLSSGEKELVYGYLHLRNISARNSIILLDEPELHLNPRLIAGLPSFYERHLGQELGNQLWMVTHSDAFLRDAFQKGGFSMYHMTPAAAAVHMQQAVPISSTNEVDRAVIDLVGDLAGYRPGQTIVIFESSEAASFDASLTLRLFPELLDKINVISGDNSFGVQQLYSALEKAKRQVSLSFEVFAILDKDSDASRAISGSRLLSWDVYHIENYLLEPLIIESVMKDFPSFAEPLTNEEIVARLRDSAEATLESLIEHHLVSHINETLRGCLDLGYDRSRLDVVSGLCGSIARIDDRLARRKQKELSDENITQMAAEVRTRLRLSLDDGTWIAIYRGRDVLRRFAGTNLKGLPYEAFRDAIIAKMVSLDFKPAGMKKVVNIILEHCNK